MSLERERDVARQATPVRPVRARSGEQVAAGRVRHRLLQGSPKTPVRPVGPSPDRTSFRAAAANRISGVAASAVSSPPEFCPFPFTRTSAFPIGACAQQHSAWARLLPCCDNLSAGSGSMQQRRKAQALMTSFRSCSFLCGLILLGAGPRRASNSMVRAPKTAPAGPWRRSREMDLGGSPPKPRWPEQSGSLSANAKQCRWRQATAERNSQPSGRGGPWRSCAVSTRFSPPASNWRRPGWRFNFALT